MQWIDETKGYRTVHSCRGSNRVAKVLVHKQMQGLAYHKLLELQQECEHDMAQLNPPVYKGEL